MGDPVLFDLPPDLPPDLEAVAILTRSVEDLRAALADLARQHAALTRRVTARRSGPPGAADGLGGPGVLRWRDMDRATATQVWQWLIAWTGWAVDHYQLQEELPACWAHHWPLVEELTGLCGAWHVATDEDASADALLRWHESLARFRARILDWDDSTKCRNGRHTDRRIELGWPDDWLTRAHRAATADTATRPADDRATTNAEPAADSAAGNPPTPQPPSAAAADGAADRGAAGSAAGADVMDGGRPR